MSASFEHPSLGTPVTSEQRERAEQHLQAVYAEGRITEEEFDRRIGQVLGADNRKELNDAFYGLVEVPSSPPAATGLSPSQSYSRMPAQQQEGSVGGALAHFSAFFTFFIIGPGIAYAVSKPGSASRREAAKAFNFQLISMVALLVGGPLTGWLDWGILNFVMGLASVAWVVLTIVGGVKAAQGDDWKNPVKKVINVNVLPEK